MWEDIAQLHPGFWHLTKSLSGEWCPYECQSPAEHLHKGRRGGGGGGGRDWVQLWQVPLWTTTFSEPECLSLTCLTSVWLGYEVKRQQSQNSSSCGKSGARSNFFFLLQLNECSVHDCFCLWAHKVYHLTKNKMRLAYKVDPLEYCFWPNCFGSNKGVWCLIGQRKTVLELGKCPNSFWKSECLSFYFDLTATGILFQPGFSSFQLSSAGWKCLAAEFRNCRSKWIYHFSRTAQKRHPELCSDECCP